MLYFPHWNQGKGPDDTNLFVASYIVISSFEKVTSALAPPTVSDLKKGFAELDENSLAIIRVMEETGARLPAYINCIPAQVMAREFLDGKVAPNIHRFVCHTAQTDLEKIAPFIKDNPGVMDDWASIPAVLTPFKCTHWLATYIGANINEDGLVTGLSPLQREVLKKQVGSAERNYPKPPNAAPR